MPPIISGKKNEGRYFSTDDPIATENIERNNPFQVGTMKNSGVRSTYAPPNRRSDATSTTAQKPVERKVTLDEMQEMAGNGKLEKFLDALGIPTASGTVNKTVKRRMGEGTSFDRETFNQAAYDKRLLKGNK